MSSTDSRMFNGICGVPCLLTAVVWSGTGKEPFLLCSLDYIRHWKDCIQDEEPTAMLGSVTGRHLPTPAAGQELLLSWPAPLHTHWHCPKAPLAREGPPEGWAELWGVPLPEGTAGVPAVPLPQGWAVVQGVSPAQGQAQVPGVPQPLQWVKVLAEKGSAQNPFHTVRCSHHHSHTQGTHFTPSTHSSQASLSCVLNPLLNQSHSLKNAVGSSMPSWALSGNAC